MQSPQDFQQHNITSTANAPPIPTKEQHSNISYAPNGGQILLGPQTAPSQHIPQMGSMNPSSTATDASNAAFAGFRRLLAELSMFKIVQNFNIISFCGIAFPYGFIR